MQEDHQSDVVPFVVHRAPRYRIATHDAADTDLHISAVTVGEIQAGIEITREQDSAKAAELEQWLELVSASFNIVPMDAAAFRPK